jgi:hypothetical protein
MTITRMTTQILAMWMSNERLYENGPAMGRNYIDTRIPIQFQSNHDSE